MAVVLLDFVNTVPPPLTAVLVQLGPVVAAIRHALQVVSWRTLWYDACLAVAFWWALCLFADVTLRYLLPVVLVVALCIPPRQQPPPTTEQSLQNTVTDLITIYALLPSRPSVPSSSTLIRIAAISYVPYLLTTYFVPLRILFALVGTLVLTARAPFGAVILSTLSRSAWVRWSVRYLLSFVTGHPLPPVVLSHQPRPASPTPVPSLAFLFTIYENQRWWMGLDWTAALLPGERPSWSSPPPAFQPVSPPNAFTLPATTTVYVADGKGGRVKRTATWHWKEPEWKVVVRRDGGTLSRVERTIPEEHASAASANGTAGSRLLKAAGIMGGNGSVPLVEADTGVEEGHEDVEEDNIATDGDGWVYGDNKWEGSSWKGGMGKYTRYRRWTRVAVVTETVDVVGAGPLGIEAADDRSDIPFPPTPGQHVHAVGTMTSSPRGSPEEESPLRQRLRRALSKASNP
ncbi:putative integral peroxisomal membrane peroxin [Lyophyllum shimeji]|uniref:Integral peroxisomal membrane peroxin n=1 Tax=Lyophyllum shimeji TaxID=47721 RepID=A0A9P3ULC6_LYOSH|nr:putative integral peroxisomal membrane peroxin [Lyophyllum shimeji]